MKKIFRLLIIAVLICSSLATKAQNDGIGFTLLPQMPYSNYYNPGINVPYRGMVGMAFSNVNAAVFNSSIKYNDMLGKNETVIDGVALVNNLDEFDNVFNTSISLDFANAGFRVSRFFINIDWRLRMNTDLNYSRDFLGFFVFGNGHYMGNDNPCDFKLGMDVTMFSELALGVQAKVNDRLTLGMRPKVLFGLANVSIDNGKTKIYTDPNSYIMTADVDLNVKAATVLQVEGENLDDFLKSMDSVASNRLYDLSENIGYGLDLGASYTINKHFGVAAGIYDLGFIRWTETKTKTIERNNVMLNDGLFDDLDEIKTMELDYSSMVEDIAKEVWGDVFMEKGKDYNTYLKTRLMLQGYFELCPMLRATAIGQMYFVKDQVYPALTLAYSGVFLNHINLMLNCTLSDYTGTAVGVGLGLHAGAFNIYAVTDNILCVTKLGSPALEMTSAYRTANIRAGIVWTIGKYNE